MVRPSSIDTIAALIRTTPSELLQCALRVTQLPYPSTLEPWLEETIQVAHDAYGTDIHRNLQAELDVWLRQTLSLVISAKRDLSDAEFLAACAESFEDFICNPAPREIVLYPAPIAVSAEFFACQELHWIDFRMGPRSLFETCGYLFEHENYADVLRNALRDTDQEAFKNQF
jgi:hypothetical protein